MIRHEREHDDGHVDIGLIWILAAAAVVDALIVPLIQAALDGAGLAWLAEDRVTDHLAGGALVRVRQDWCPPFPGFFLYYPSQKQQPAALAALVEMLRMESTPAVRQQ
jgi:DNA-binding transcriptional LysR family regulator